MFTYYILGDTVRFYFVDDKCYIVFINNFISNIDFKNKNELEQFLKKTIKWIDSKYDISISGLFEVDIFVNDKVGIFIKFEKINSVISYKDTDLKINIIYNCQFYFKTSQFECLEEFEKIYFNEGYYYINVDKLSNLDKFIELGDVVYDNKLNLERDFIRVK